MTIRLKRFTFDLAVLISTLALIPGCPELLPPESPLAAPREPDSPAAEIAARPTPALPVPECELDEYGLRRRVIVLREGLRCVQEPGGREVGQPLKYFRPYFVFATQRTNGRPLFYQIGPEPYRRCIEGWVPADAVASWFVPAVLLAALVTLLAWALCSQTGRLSKRDEYTVQSLSWLEELQLNKPVADTLRNMHTGESESQNLQLLLRIGISHQDWYEVTKKESLQGIMKNWFADPEVQNFLRVNRYQEVLWYNREAFNDFIWWMAVLALCKHAADPATDSTSLTEVILHLKEITTELRKIDEKSGYKFDRLFELATK